MMKCRGRSAVSGERIEIEFDGLIKSVDPLLTSADDDGIFIAVKESLFKGTHGAMGHAGERKNRRRVDPLPIKAGEEGSGRCPVEAFVVIEDPNSQSFPSTVLPPTLAAATRGCEPKANRNDIPKEICQGKN